MAGNMLDALSKAGFDASEVHKERKEQYKREERNHHKHKSGNNSRRNHVTYVGAPYNFVPQWEKVVKREKEDCVAHDVLDDELLSGEITYRFTTETELSIGDGGEGFYQEPYGSYAIPGSSVRGMVRHNAQILSLSSIADDVDDYFLMFREVGGRNTNPNKRPYDSILGAGQVMLAQKTVSVLKNVRAGYIVKEGEKYKIYRTKVDRINDTLGKINYYILNERIIAKDKSHEKYPFYWDNPNYTQHVLNEGFHAEEVNGRVHLKGKKNYSYTPYYASVSYSIKGERFVEYVGRPGKDGYLQGVALGTGKMNEKKCQYIIPEIDMDKPSIVLKDDDIKAFKIDYQHKLNQLKGMFGSRATFFELPKDGEKKPIFYIERDNRIYFGFTPRLRLFYNHPVKDGLSKSQKEIRIDYAKSLFGFSDSDDSYKTRLSFSDAVIVSGQMSGTRKVILGEPSLSSYNDYITTDNDGRAVTYNKDGFRLRGVKQYWLRDEIIGSAEGKNNKVTTSFAVIGANAIFEGKLRFHNLTETELGLILWCLKLNPESRQQIGRAKPYGYGRIKPEITGLSLLDAKKAYSDSGFNLMPIIKSDLSKIDEYVDAYKKEINEAIKNLGVGSSIDDMESVRDFFAMKDSENLAVPKEIRYMSIDKREYQNRAPLPYVADVKRM